MKRIEKLTRRADTEQAKTQKLRCHFTQMLLRIKREFFRLVVWWRIAWDVDMNSTNLASFTGAGLI